MYIAVQSYGQLNDCDVAFILNATIRNRVADDVADNVADDVVVEIKLSDIERAILKHFMGGDLNVKCEFK